MSGEISEKSKHPYEDTNALSKLFFCWTIPTFIEGCRKDLDESDLHGFLNAHDARLLGNQMHLAWQKQKSLPRTIWNVFGCEIFIYGVFLFIIEFGVKLAHPFCLGRLLQYVQGQTSITKNEALAYGSSIILLTFLGIIFGHHYVMGTQHLGMKVRVACSSLIYRKSLKISKTAAAETGVGKLINILTNDVGRFDYTFTSFHNIWAAPIQIIIVTSLLYFMMGLYALAGILFFCLFIPIQIFLAKKTTEYRRKTAIKTDERVGLINEIVSGIQLIKMYTWEAAFGELAGKARKLEIKYIRSNAMIKAINASVSTFLNRTALYFAVLAYTLAGNNPQAYYIFVVSSFYNILRQPLVFHVPNALSSLAETSVSIRRIESFLNLEEIDERGKEISGKTVGIFFHDVFAKRDSDRHNILTSVHLSAKKKELVAIIGATGSGKSSLFQVILKELPIIKGVLDVSGSVSYASQEPWLLTSTIKENILFGEEFHPERYEEVCQVCALAEDFSFLPLGDNTIVGERGITLSGGQRTRINLARAIYKEADIYLLDDPLSSVDAHVAKRIFQDCITGFLKDKCVLLITHQLQFLKNAQRIYMVRDGRAECCEAVDSIEEDVLSELAYRQVNEGKREQNVKGFTTVLPPEKPNTETKERKETGSIQGNVYKTYLQTAGGCCTVILVVSLFVASQTLASSVDYFVAYWTNVNDTALNETGSRETSMYQHIFSCRENTLYLYSSLISLTIILTLVRSTTFMRICVNASRRLYNKMSRSVLNTALQFFYLNTAGRILNRFSKDTGLVDEVLPLVMLEALQVSFNLMGVVILVAIINAWMLIPSVVIVVTIYWLKRCYLATSQDLKRIEATARSPMYSRLKDSVQGLETIRALKGQNYLIRDFEAKQNAHSSAFYLFMACNRAFGIWLDLTCGIYIGIVIMGLLLVLDDVSAGNVGLVITQSLTLTGMLQFGIRQWSEVENHMTAVERIVEYTKLEPETEQCDKQTKYPNWPKSGGIEFKNVCLRYNPAELFALKNITCRIKPKEKIGIVGRTGAGKTSIILSLFRIVETTGSILIDDVNTKTLPLDLLRSKISILPQVPILLRGTLRRNLDPFEVYKDDELWAVLKEVGLETLTNSLAGGLYSKISEGGCNLSVGEKQLLCIARALLRNNKVMVLDEATSSVDQETDKMIQNVVRNKFGNCTVIIVAHRLRTIMNSDKIMVLDRGSVVEFDHPHSLLQNKNSHFHQLLTQAEDAELLELK